MKMKLLNLSKEIKHIIIIILLLTIVFAFDDGKPTLVLSDWFSNFIYILGLVAITVIINALGYKAGARYYSGKIEYHLWGIKQFWYSRASYFRKFKNMYVGAILAILIAFLSLGRAFFTAISTFSLTISRKLGRTRPKAEGAEEAKIALIGLIFNAILLIIFKILSIDKGISINMWFILWHLLPFSDLPGAKIFSGSRTLYILVLFFFIFFLLLFSVINTILAIIIAIIFAAILAILFFYYVSFPK